MPGTRANWHHQKRERRSNVTRKFQMEAEGGYWLAFERKTPAVLGKDRLGQPLSVAGTTLPRPFPVRQESEALGPLLGEVRDF